MSERSRMTGEMKTGVLVTGLIAAAVFGIGVLVQGCSSDLKIACPDGTTVELTKQASTGYDGNSVEELQRETCEGQAGEVERG